MATHFRANTLGNSVHNVLTSNERFEHTHRWTPRMDTKRCDFHNLAEVSVQTRHLKSLHNFYMRVDSLDASKMHFLSFKRC
jgi:hypothetical protein